MARMKKAVTGGATNGVQERIIGRPLFAQPQPTADPTTFKIKHASDAAAYAALDALRRQHMLKPLPFPAPRGGVEPKLTLEEVLGGNAQIIKGVTSRGQIVFHALGDCGSTKGPQTEVLVTDKLVSDFDEAHPMETPQFNLLLGDIVYSFGEAQYYYDQFYEPYRDYPAPILAVAGNHDGIVAPSAHVKSLDAFLRNFCADQFVVTDDAGGLSRTAQIQPGVFFTFEAPFVRVVALYSNALEDPGVISSPEIGDSQLKFLEAALNRVKADNFTGALLFAHHHPVYVASAQGGRHGGSPEMLAQIDKVCAKVGVWPHADLAGHVHNYQRFTRLRPDGTEIPYVSCGNGGHNAQALIGAPRAPQVIQSGRVTRGIEKVDRPLATASTLPIQYPSCSPVAVGRAFVDERAKLC